MLSYIINIIHNLAHMNQDVKKIISVILISTFLLYPVVGMIALATYLTGIVLMFVWYVGNIKIRLIVTLASIVFIVLYLSSFTLINNPSESNIPKRANVRNITNF